MAQIKYVCRTEPLQSVQLIINTISSLKTKEMQTRKFHLDVLTCALCGIYNVFYVNIASNTQQ